MKDKDIEDLFSDDDFAKLLSEHVEADGLLAVDPEEGTVKHPEIRKESRN